MTLDEYRNGLRIFIRDFADLNRLLKFEEENRNENLDLYLNMSLGYLNALPPPTGNYFIDTFPIPSLLIHQAAIECLISNGILQARNELTYSNGGISVKIPDKNRYTTALDQLMKRTSVELDAFIKQKVGLNIDGGWGGVFSPYLNHGRNPYLRTNHYM